MREEAPPQRQSKSGEALRDSRVSSGARASHFALHTDRLRAHAACQTEASGAINEQQVEELRQEIEALHAERDAWGQGGSDSEDGQGHRRKNRGKVNAWELEELRATLMEEKSAALQQLRSDFKDTLAKDVAKLRLQAKQQQQALTAGWEAEKVQLQGVISAYQEQHKGSDPASSQTLLAGHAAQLVVWQSGKGTVTVEHTQWAQTQAHFTDSLTRLVIVQEGHLLSQRAELGRLTALHRDAEATQRDLAKTRIEHEAMTQEALVRSVAQRLFEELLTQEQEKADHAHALLAFERESHAQAQVRAAGEQALSEQRAVVLRADLEVAEGQVCMAEAATAQAVASHTKVTAQLALLLDSDEDEGDGGGDRKGSRQKRRNGRPSTGRASTGRRRAEDSRELDGLLGGGEWPRHHGNTENTEGSTWFGLSTAWKEFNQPPAITIPGPARHGRHSILPAVANPPSPQPPPGPRHPVTGHLSPRVSTYCGPTTDHISSPLLRARTSHLLQRAAHAHSPPSPTSIFGGGVWDAHTVLADAPSPGYHPRKRISAPAPTPPAPLHTGKEPSDSEVLQEPSRPHTVSTIAFGLDFHTQAEEGWEQHSTAQHSPTNSFRQLSPTLAARQHSPTPSNPLQHSSQIRPPKNPIELAVTSSRSSLLQPQG